jgi:hypothetical protein
MFDCTIEYRKGTNNQTADALSRMVCEEDNEQTENEYATVVINFIMFDADDLRQQKTTDSNIQWLIDLKSQALAENKHKIEQKLQTLIPERQSLYRQWDRMIVLDGILYRKWTDKALKTSHLQYVTPTTKRRAILEQCHDSNVDTWVLTKHSNGSAKHTTGPNSKQKHNNM